MWKRLFETAALAVVLLGTGSGCRLCDRYCDRRDDCDRRCNDPCRSAPRANDDCRCP